MKRLSLLLVSVAGPAFAADGPFLSLRNTDFVVLIAFILFVALILKLRAPSRIMGLLDKRAAAIRSDLEEARALREEAQSILASYERKAREVQAQADAIVTAARRDAQMVADKAKADLEVSIARRLKAAEDQIASAESGAIREVKDQAVSVAIAAAGAVLAKQMSAAEKSSTIDTAIAEVKTRLH